jgi:hypothetical protein
MELSTVVKGYRSKHFSMLRNYLNGCCIDFEGCAGLKLFDDSVSWTPLNQGQDAETLVPTDDSVTLSVPWFLAQLNLGRTLRNVPIAPQHSPGILAVVTLSAFFWHEPHVPIQIDISLFVFKNVPINRFVADAADAQHF